MYLGGQGQRKLNLVTTESEGYNARLLKNVSVNGKHILYVVPLQERLDETPLPHDAPEFERMPKSTCQKCGIIMPLQFLALHITSCGNVDDVSITQILTLSEWSLVNFWISILYGKRDVAFLISRRGSLYVCLEIISQNAAQTSLCTLPGGKLSVPLKHLIYSLTFKS